MKLAEKKDIGERIRSMRKGAGLTQDELAERCGMKQQYIQYLETGKRKPGIEVLEKIAAALGKRIDFV